MTSYAIMWLIRRSMISDTHNSIAPRLQLLQVLLVLLHKHYLENHADQDLFDAIFLKIIRLASVADLREVAAMLQDPGDLDASEDLNWIAAIKSEEIFLNC
jgi:hypothetical protein